MGGRRRSRYGSIWYPAGFIVWLVINIRVEAGVATVLERALDGLVGGVLLLVSIFLALRFFGDGGEGKGRPGARWPER